MKVGAGLGESVSIANEYFCQEVLWKHHHPLLQHVMAHQGWMPSRSPEHQSQGMSRVTRLATVSTFGSLTYLFWNNDSRFIWTTTHMWSETEVEAAVWNLVGDAAAAGRLLVDLTSVELSRSNPLALFEPSAPPILPDPLPSSLEKAEDEDNEPPSVSVESGDDVLEYQGVIPGPTFSA